MPCPQAASRLALAQQSSLEDLMARQEQERKSLRLEFERRQRELVQQILQQFPGLSLGAGGGQGKENTPPAARQISRQGPVRNLETSFTDISSLEAESRTSSTPGPLSPPGLDDLEPSFDEKALDVVRGQKPVVRSSTFKVSQSRGEVTLPSAALAPLHSLAWVRLTALARGFLTRRLLATEGVSHLKRTIAETLACAVQLHLEAGAGPSKQELDLHSRLLAQLEAACAKIHHIFFTLTTSQRMKLIAADRAARQARADRSSESDSRPRLSAATAARLASKSAGGGGSSRFEVKRRRVVLSSRAGLRSPRSRMVRSIYSSGSGGRPATAAGGVMSKSVGSGGSSKPSWK